MPVLDYHPTNIGEELSDFVIKDSQLVRGQRYFDLYSKYSAINKLRPQNQRLHTVL